ncbi:MmcQ/YjbR family DNA-binding protein [Campylobacter geochelonis]|nr:MmcQ/YjbR family DNA-binding protein [Campylobacter geochelonis]CZE46138.1 30S ribosomal protein S8 [Campylobacter geochelonis]CZE50780.1 30S ribosomal protein S8 [Campylobacter geochelonis]
MKELNLDDIKRHCLAKKGTFSEFSFGDDTLVFKVGNEKVSIDEQGKVKQAAKIFALIFTTKKPLWLNLKANPAESLVYREIYSFVKPGYHMNKRHWNTLVLDCNAEKSVVFEMIDQSYELVIAKLSKQIREKLL